MIVDVTLIVMERVNPLETGVLCDNDHTVMS